MPRYDRSPRSRRWRSATIGAAFASALFPAAAMADVTCTGTVVSVDFAGDALLKADIGYGVNQLCFVDKSVSKDTGPYGTISITKEYCQALLANLMTAKANGRQVSIWWDLPSCPTVQDTGKFPYNFKF